MLNALQDGTFFTASGPTCCLCYNLQVHLMIRWSIYWSLRCWWDAMGVGVWCWCVCNWQLAYSFWRLMVYTTQKQEKYTSFTAYTTHQQLTMCCILNTILTTLMLHDIKATSMIDRWRCTSRAYTLEQTSYRRLHTHTLYTYLCPNYTHITYTSKSMLPGHSTRQPKKTL